MEKEQILKDIRRLAAASGGKPPGSQRFQSEMNLGKADWYPKYWLRWSDAIREAGLEPNTLSARFDEEFLIKCYLDLTRELGRFPIEGDLMVKRRGDRNFPNRDAFARLGSKAERAIKILAYCHEHGDFASLVPLVESAVIATSPENGESSEQPTVGYVYLLRHGIRR